MLHKEAEEAERVTALSLSLSLCLFLSPSRLGFSSKREIDAWRFHHRSLSFHPAPRVANHATSINRAVLYPELATRLVQRVGTKVPPRHLVRIAVFFFFSFCYL